MSEFGRIADDGTVYVRAGDGEREIGSWQAGDHAAGLAFYTRRYDDLTTEVALLEKRLASGAGDPAATRTQATHLKDQLATAAVIGDLAALQARLDTVLGRAEEAAGAAAAQRARAKAEAVEAKEKLVAEAESIAESATSWKASGDRLRLMVEEWKAIKGVDRKTDDALWKRFAAARDAFGRRRGQHFAQLDAERTGAREAKEKLIKRAEELSGSSDWKATADALRGLMTEWKAVGRAGRDVEDELWARFRAAQDAFYARRSDTFAERDAEQVGNQKRKEEIIARAEAIDLRNPQAAQSTLRGLQADYDDVGHVPRDAIKRLDDRMRSAEQRVRDAVDTEYRQSAADSNPFLAALRARLVEAEAKLERARKSGDADRIAKAETEVQQRRALLP